MSNEVSANILKPTSSNNPSNEAINKNTQLVYRAALCWAFMFGFGESSFSLYADYSKTPMSFFAALVWIPGFVGPCIQILAANLLDKYKTRIKMCYLPVYIQASCFVPLFIIAIWSEEINRIIDLGNISASHYIFIFSIFIYSLSGNFATPPWQSFIGDLISQQQRGKFFARISRINTFFVLLSQLLVGIVLYYVAIYFNGSVKSFAIVYGSCFLISFIARLISGKYIQNMYEIPYQTNESSVFTFIQFIKRAPESNFVKYVIFVSALNCAMNIASPYFLPFWSNTLAYSQTKWIVITSIGTLTSILTFMAWGRFSDHFGNKQTIKYCSIFLSFIHFGWLISTNFYFLVFLQIIAMIFFTGFALSTLNYIYEAASPPKRARCFAYFSLLTGIGTLIGTQIGLLILNHFPKDFMGVHFESTFYWVLIISCLARILACALFLTSFKELREVKPFKMNSFWVDVLELRSVLGIPLTTNKENNSQKETRK